MPACKLIDVGNAKRWPKSLAAPATLAISGFAPLLRSRMQMRDNSFAKKKQAFSMVQEPLRNPAHTIRHLGNSGHAV